MSKNSGRILAIDPGTKHIGVAVLDAGELIFYGVKTVPDRSTAQRILSRIAAITQELITKFNPTCLAIERTFVIQKSEALLSVAAEEIKSIAMSNKVPIFEYAPGLIRKVVCNNSRGVKRNLAEIVAQRYPILGKHLRHRNQWEEKYYARVFDAVGVGLMRLKDAGHDPNQQPLFAA